MIPARQMLMLIGVVSVFVGGLRHDGQSAEHLNECGADQGRVERLDAVLHVKLVKSQGGIGS
jgi:hypothetical protein